METSSKSEESSSNKDTNKNKKNDESKEPELVSIPVFRNNFWMFGIVYWLITADIMVAAQIRYVIVLLK